SDSPVASVEPCGEKATAWKCCSLSTRRSSLPVTTSHSRTECAPAEARVCPSGEKATAMTKLSCPSSRCSSLPVATSPPGAVRAPAPGAGRRPAGEQGAAAQLLTVPFHCRGSFPVATSQTQRVPSQSRLNRVPAVPRVLPSGEKRHDVNQPLLGFRNCRSSLNDAVSRRLTTAPALWTTARVLPSGE